MFLLRLHTALTKRVEAMEGLVGERDARITALEKALDVAEAKLAAKTAGARFAPQAYMHPHCPTLPPAL